MYENSFMKIEVENSQYISVYMRTHRYIHIYTHVLYTCIYISPINRLLYLVFLRSNYSCMTGFKFPLFFARFGPVNR